MSRIYYEYHITEISVESSIDNECNWQLVGRNTIFLEPRLYTQAHTRIHFVIKFCEEIFPSNMCPSVYPLADTINATLGISHIHNGIVPVSVK